MTSGQACQDTRWAHQGLKIGWVSPTLMWRQDLLFSRPPLPCSPVTTSGVYGAASRRGGVCRRAFHKAAAQVPRPQPPPHLRWRTRLRRPPKRMVTGVRACTRCTRFAAAAGLERESIFRLAVLCLAARLAAAALAEPAATGDRGAPVDARLQGDRLGGRGASAAMGPGECAPGLHEGEGVGALYVPGWGPGQGRGAGAPPQWTVGAGDWPSAPAPQPPSPTRA